MEKYYRFQVLLPLVIQMVIFFLFFTEKTVVQAETLFLPLTRDTWVSSHPGEEEGNNGSSSRLKIKGYQEFSLIDFDCEPLKYRTIRRATLHVTLAGDETLKKIGTSTLATDWVEGTGKSYEKVVGSSFRWKQYPDVPWSDVQQNEAGYTDLTSVMFSEAETIWSHADATEPVKDARTGLWRQSIPIDPRIIEARVAGNSYGIVIFDDTGTELVRKGEKGEEVEIRLFPNRYFFSKDQNAAVAPVLEVEVSDVQLPTLGDVWVLILDELDKLDFYTSSKDNRTKNESKTTTNDERRAILSELPENKHIWSSSQQTIDLSSAGNEFIGFQVVLLGNGKNIVPKLTFEESNAPNIQTKFFQFEYVGSEQGPVADPLLPLNATGINVEKASSIFCEIYIPKGIVAGLHTGTLTLENEQGEKATLKVTLRIWNFQLPDKLSFYPEMNAYRVPVNERDYYRLAQLHRTYINCVPYSHRGMVHEGAAPMLKEGKFDWATWDQRFGEYFDGSAFADLPRGAVPIEAFYLPLHENWPVSIFLPENYNGNDWADNGFSENYAKQFASYCGDFAEHIAHKKWEQTLFEFYLNNKMDYKKNGWSRASSPWLLDEPASFRDFCALKYFGEKFHEGKNEREKALQVSVPNLVFRADISRPQWARDSLDHLLNVNIVGGRPFHTYNRMVRQKKEKFNQLLYTYGTTCSPEKGALQPVLWAIDSWTLGADGIVPWDTMGSEHSWKKADPLALFYPARNTNERGPFASIRLKSYRRAQQDIEYLNLFVTKSNLPRTEVEQSVRKNLRLTSKLSENHVITNAEDAGTVTFEGITLEEVWKLRKHYAELLDMMKHL